MLNWVEIDAGALTNNVREFRRRLGGQVKLGAVVKSNAYGHGMLEAASVMRDAGADWLCVNGIDEAIGLREAGHDLPVLVMGYVSKEALAEVVTRDLRPVVYNLETVERLDALAERFERRTGRTVQDVLGE